MTILMNSKNPEMQKKHIQLLACRSRAITIKNLSEMSELLLNCTIVSFTAQLDNTGIAIWPRSGQRSARIAHMSQFRCSHYLGVRDHCWGYPQSSYCITMVLNRLVATLVVRTAFRQETSLV